MFEEVVKMFKDIYAYYFDLPFEETANRTNFRYSFSRSWH